MSKICICLRRILGCLVGFSAKFRKPVFREKYRLGKFLGKIRTWSIFRGKLEFWLFHRSDAFRVDGTCCRVDTQRNRTAENGGVW